MDAHWRGAIVVATGLRDAGMEVVYLGHATPEELVAVVTQEDADLLGLSSLSGNHLGECRRVMEGFAGADLGELVGLGEVAALVDGRRARGKTRCGDGHPQRSGERYSADAVAEHGIQAAVFVEMSADAAHVSVATLAEE